MSGGCRATILVLGIAAFTACHRHECGAPPARGASEPFDHDRWSACPGDHRTAMARTLVDDRRLIGRPLADAEALLGPTELDKDGDSGWLLGVPDGSPSLMPNELILAIVLDANGRIANAKLVDTFEGPPLAGSAAAR